MDKKSYKRIDWSKRKPIEECVPFGDTNGNHFDCEIRIDENTPIISDDLKESITVD